MGLLLYFILCMLCSVARNHGAVGWSAVCDCDLVCLF